MIVFSNKTHLDKCWGEVARDTTMALSQRILDINNDLFYTNRC